jgi:hypothetical protein
VVTSKRIGGVEERDGADTNKDTCDRDCTDLSAHGGVIFSKCQKFGR